MTRTKLPWPIDDYWSAEPTPDSWNTDRHGPASRAYREAVDELVRHVWWLARLPFPKRADVWGDAVERLGGLRSRLNGQNAIANLEDAVWTLATTPRRGDTSERERCDEWEVTYRRNVLIDDFNARREAECTTPLSEVLNQRSHNAPYPT